jgi:hypothetical protein
MPRRFSSPSPPLPRISLSIKVALAVLLWWSATGTGLAFNTIRCQLADGFDFPVGKPEGDGYYKARGFWPNGHLGEDWNGRGGGDSDLGDPIYCIGNGVVVLSEDVKVGWGNVIIIRHAYREITGKIEIVDSLYGHLYERKLKVGQVVERGTLVGLMGGNSGMYPVHLHLEVRKNLAIGMNRSSFARDYSNYHSPTAFINAHRRLAADARRYDIPIDTFAPYGGELTDAQEQVSRSTSPSTYTHKSPSARASQPDSSGVIRTGRGLRIPVVGGAARPGGSPSPAPAPAPTAPTTSGAGTTPGATPAPAPDPAAPAADKNDFWSRLKGKLKDGQVTPGMEEKK